MTNSTYKVTYRCFNGDVVTVQTYHHVTCDALFHAIIAVVAFTETTSFQVVCDGKDITNEVLHFVYKDIKSRLADNIKTASNKLTEN